MTPYRIGHAPRRPRRPLRFRLLYAACVSAAFVSAFLAGSWVWVHAGAVGGVLVALCIVWLALRTHKQASPSVPSGTALAVDAPLRQRAVRAGLPQSQTPVRA